MSHFAVGVIIPHEYEDDESGILDFIGDKMSPYDESLEVAPYKVECECVGLGSFTYGAKMADIYVGSVEKDIRPAFDTWAKATYGEDFRKHSMNGDEIDKAMDVKWKEMLIPFLKLRQETIDQYQPYHPNYGKADPMCEDCVGTGQRISHYNKDSKWDYWVVGGRYNGRLYNKTGKPDDIADVYDENQIKVSDYIADYLATGNFDNTPLMFAFVDPDGFWYQRGRMGWWGIVRNEQPDEEWHNQVAELLKKHMNDFIVSLDCHI